MLTRQQTWFPLIWITVGNAIYAPVGHLLTGGAFIALYHVGKFR